jgi:hypothetical protein
MRRWFVTLLVGVVAIAGLSLAADPPGDQDEPPIRLKKKAKPDAPKEDPMKKPAPEEKKPEPGAKDKDKEKDDEPEAAPPAEDEQEVLNRLLKNTRTAEERLANKEVNDSTQQLQRDILRDLDELIKRAQEPPQGGQDQQQQQQQGGGQDQKQQQGGQQQQGGKMSRAQSRQQRRQGRSGQRQQGRQGNQNQPGQGQGNQDNQQNMAQGGGQQPGGGGKSQEDPNKLADLYKDIWGHLPETMRAEMNAYSREKFMSKYEDLIKKYYASVAEKGRKKD